MPKHDFDAWATTRITGEPYLSVIIATFNEEWEILPHIQALARRVCRFDLPWELIVSDDGSGDMTPEMVDDLNYPNVHVLRGAPLGRGAAARAGMLAAGGRYLLFADSDDTTPFEEIGAFLKALDTQGYDISVGCRQAMRGRPHATDEIVWLVRRLLSIPVHDAACDFKMYRREVAHRLYGAQTFTGSSFDLEILHLAMEWGYRVVEIPLNWPAAEERATPDAFDVLRDLAKIEFNDLRGRYRMATSR